ncbi:Hsp20/alpha crystallin family protein [Methylobacter sp. YRD-M1]|uniref:Hsp20/alpha crystallin family protein n=1 Tax=Methylobacter sp. YRD-M1 TaxID=2911520 RepID=UPI00227C03F7|nr:Hsp20/alpha crystallin family protein [Methylobacter sp. YRD-M1]WAK04059.1 Hsp20/alpha crystallin family protein [Methylobacter sp. YRD-M1]
MPLRNFELLMWAEACEVLERAERLHRQFFRPVAMRARRPAWEPPIDIYETLDEFRIIVALPGVEPEHISVSLEGGQLVVSGRRYLPVDVGAEIQRLEIPYGRFERSIELPEGRFNLGGHEFLNGCLLIILRKIG